MENDRNSMLKNFLDTPVSDEIMEGAEEVREDFEFVPLKLVTPPSSWCNTLFSGKSDKK